MPNHLFIDKGYDVVPGAVKALAVYLSISQDASFNNVTIRPMLADSDVVVQYSDYFKGLRDTKVTELRSEGANLLNTLAEESVPSNTASANTTPRIFTPNTMILGIAPNNYYNPNKTMVVKKTQDSITFTNSSGYSLGFAFDLKPNTQYTVSCVSSIANLQIGVGRYNADGTFNSQKTALNTYYTFTTTQSGKTVIVFMDRDAGNGATTEITISNVMLTEGTSRTYKPYRAEAVDTFPISAELRAFLDDKGYGRGVEGYPNYIDFERKVFVQRSYRIVFDGTEPWEANGTKDDADYYNKIIFGRINAPAGVYHGNSVVEQGISNYYDIISGDNVFIRNRGVALMDDRINIYDPSYNTSDVSLWKTHLADLYARGNPLVAVYVLGEPIEIDISAYLTDEGIIVEGGGAIIPVNPEYNNPAFVECMFTEFK